jgi:hypothetical protein
VADRVVTNSGDLDELRAETDLLWDELRARAN